MVKDANALSGAMGQAAREADGWENVTGNLKETWKQFQAVVGQPILKIATAVVKQLTTALEKLTVYATAAVNSLSKLFGWDASALTTKSASFPLGIDLGMSLTIRSSRNAGFSR